MEFLLTFHSHISERTKSMIKQKILDVGLDVEEENLSEVKAFRIKTKFAALAEQAEILKYEKLRRFAWQGKTIEIMTDFKLNDFQHFIGSDDVQNFFKPAEQNSLMRSLLYSITLEQKEVNDVILERNQGYMIPLLMHSSPEIIEEFHPLHNDTQRAETWREFKNNLLRIPFDSLRDYFGEEVALYFVFMDFFMMSLLFPGLLGLYFYLTRPVGMDVDHSQRLLYFGLIMMIWGILFVTLFQRRQATFTYRWNTYDFEKVPEIRPEFFGEMRISPVTDKLEKYYPTRKRLPRYFLSVLLTIPMLLLGLGAMTLSLNLNGYVKDHSSPFYFARLCAYAEPGGIFAQDNPYNGWIIPTILHSVVIFIINSIYRRIAEWCTDMENHRTQSDWNNSLIFKRVLFEAFDCYLALFYIAFYRLEINFLRSELVGLFWGDEIRRLFTEVFIPFLTSHFKRASLEKKSKREDITIIEDTVLDEYEQFDDYLEMVIQYGYVTLFASAFPLASIITIIFVAIEIKSDAFKLLHITKRPFARRSAGIGVWLNIMCVMTVMAIISNCMLIGFSSEQLEGFIPQFYTFHDNDHFIKEGFGRYVVAIVFAIEHFILLCGAVAVWIIPLQPAWVRNGKLRKAYLQSEFLSSQL